MFRVRFLATLGACALFIACLIGAFWGWFGVHLYGSLSRAPQAWAYFAAFVGAASLPVLLSIAVAAYIAGQHEERVRENANHLVKELTDLLEHVSKSSNPGNGALTDLAIGAERILEGSPRPLPRWAQALLATRIRLAVRSYYGLDAVPAEWRNIFTLLETRS